MFQIFIDFHGIYNWFRLAKKELEKLSETINDVIVEIPEQKATEVEVEEFSSPPPKSWSLRMREATTVSKMCAQRFSMTVECFENRESFH